MKNRWNTREAARFISRYKAFGMDLALRTYSARLIGQDPQLVLHGGGNTSVKTELRAITGEPVRVLCIKGSGWDLDTIEPAGHPAVRLKALEALRALPNLSDEAMVNTLRANMLDSTGPTPSVESLLHAFLPHKFIDHSHADAVLALTNQPQAEKRIREWTKGRMGIVPYIMPGFALSKRAAQVYEKQPDVEGLILLKHGIFTFGDTARQSYDRMISWVHSAEQQARRGKTFGFQPLPGVKPLDRSSVAQAAHLIRGQCRLPGSGRKESDAYRGMLVRHRTSRAILAFVNSRQAPWLSQQGPVTPDHIIRTKALPLSLPPLPLRDEERSRDLLKKAFTDYIRTYQSYFKKESRRKGVQRQALDPLPRIVLAPGAGLFAIAADVKAADIALDIYEHTIEVIRQASRIGSYEALPPGDLFDMEYWSLEQAKLEKVQEQPFSRKIVWISGAASGIGLATAEAFLKAGAHVYLTDTNRVALAATLARCSKTQAAGSVCDVTKPAQVQDSFIACSLLFGGVDIVVSNAGYAPAHSMADCPEDLLRKSYEVNFFAHQTVARRAIDIFRRQQIGGVLLFNASKSAFNPGPGFGPYSLPKAGLIALMRQYAIESGSLGVRVNAVNADRVRTHLFDEGLLAKRAQARGLSVTEYLAGNLLGEEVYAEDVAQAFLALAAARKTTGAVLPVDGGNTAAFPR